MPFLPPEDEHQNRVNEAWMHHTAQHLRTELASDSIPSDTPDQDVLKYYHDTYAPESNSDEFNRFLSDSYGHDFKAPSETFPEKTAGVVRGIGQSLPSLGQQVGAQTGAGIASELAKQSIFKVGAPAVGVGYLARMAAQMHGADQLSQIANAMPEPDINVLQKHYFQSLSPGLTAKGYTTDQIAKEVQRRVSNVIRGYVATQNSLMGDLETTSQDMISSAAEGMANVGLLGAGGGFFKNALMSGARRAAGEKAAQAVTSTVAGRLITHAVTGAGLGAVYGGVTGGMEAGAQAAQAGKSVVGGAAAGTIGGATSGALGGAALGGPLGAALDALGAKAVMDATMDTPAPPPEPASPVSPPPAVEGQQVTLPPTEGTPTPTLTTPLSVEHVGPAPQPTEIAPRLPAPSPGPPLEGPPRGRVEPLDLPKPLTLPEPDADLMAARASGQEPHSISLPTEPVERITKAAQFAGGEIEGAKVSIRPSVDGRRLVIDSLKGAEHGTGASGKALDRIIATADEQGVPIDVTVADYSRPRGGIIPADKIAKWYERRGFTRVNETEGSITLHRPSPDPNPPLTSDQIGALAEHHIGVVQSSEDAAQLDAFMKRAEGLPEGRAQEALGNIEEGKPMIRGAGTSGQPSVGMRLGGWLDQQAAAADERIRSKLGRLSTGFDPTLIGDYAIKAAAKMYRLGLTAVKSLKGEMLQEHPGIPDLAMKEIISQARDIISKRLNGDSVTVTTLTRLLKAAEEGRVGADWYDKTAGAVHKMFGQDGDMFLRFLAATSAGKAADANVTLALKAYGQWKLGLPFDGFIGNDQAMLEKASRGEVFGDRKLQSILGALRGDENSVAIDRHVMRALGFEKAGAEKGSLSDREYDFFEAVLRDLARSRGMTPRQFQAALWTSSKIRQAQVATTPREMAHLHSFRPYEGIMQFEHGISEDTGKTPLDWVNEHRVTLQNLSNAAEGVTKTRAGGGFTYSPYDYSAYRGNHGVVVTLASVKIPTNKLSASEVIGFTQKFKKLLASYYGMNTGTFNLEQAGEPGQTSMDLNVVLPESMRDRAIELGKARKQRALWDLGKEETIPTGYEGPTADAPTDPVQRGQWWKKQHAEIDQVMQKLGIPSRSLPGQEGLDKPQARVTSSDQYWGLEAEQAMPKNVHDQLEAAKTPEEITNVIATNEKPLAEAFKQAGLAQSPESLQGDGSATDLLRYYLRKKGIDHEIVLGKNDAGDARTWVRAKDGSELDPSGEGMNNGQVVKDTEEPELKRGQIEAMLRTPHRWHEYVAQALNIPEDQIKTLVNQDKLHPISDAGMLDHVEVHKDGTVWEYVDPTPPSYNIMKLVGRFGGNKTGDLLNYLDGKQIISGHDIVQNYRAQAGYVSTAGIPKLEAFARKAPIAKINAAMVKNGGEVVPPDNYRYGDPQGTSLWISPDGKLIHIPFHVRNADKVIKALRLKNPVPYQGPEHDVIQTILNHGYVRVQMHEQSYAADSSVPLTSQQIMALRTLRKGPKGMRDFAGRLVNPNGEHRAIYDDFSSPTSNSLTKYIAESRSEQ